MPFTIHPDFQAALKRSIRLSVALRMERKDGTVLAWTNHTRDTTLPAFTVGQLTVPSTFYRSGGCALPNAIQQSEDIRTVDNFEFTAFFDNRFSEADVAKGFFHDARFTLLIYARENLEWQILRMRGIVCEHTLYTDRVVWMMRDLAQLLQADVLEVTSPQSRARWGDPELAFFNLDGNTADGFAARVTGPVGSVDAQHSRRIFTLAGTQDFPAGRFVDGTVTWLSGANAGHVAQVLDWGPGEGTFVLCESAPREIAVGDIVRAQIKAPSTFDEWMTCFGDGRYFAGEPQIPTLEKAMEVSRG